MAKVQRLLRPGPMLAREVAIMHIYTHPDPLHTFVNLGIL